MRLRNPGGLEAALEAVKQVKGQLWTAATAGHSATARKDAFLTWCDQWATPQLGSHFPSSEVLFAEIVESYHRVVQTPFVPERQLNGVLDREGKAWSARLDGLIAELEHQKPFLARPGHLVVLDTSALIEGVFFTEFDWHALDPAVREGPIRLIVPSLVIEELDELKRRDARQKAQARKVLRTLWELHRPRSAEPAPLPDRPNISAEVLLDGGWHQRQPNNDGEIIDQAVAVHELTGRPVLLAAGDYAMLYRAAPRGVTAVLMPRPDEA